MIAESEWEDAARVAARIEDTMAAMLENRVAIITGGTGALGRAVAAAFAAEGAKLGVPYVVDAELPIFEARVRPLVSGADAILARHVDVSDEKQAAAFVEEVASRFGRIDILVNLVGGFWGGKSIAETSMSEWNAMFDLNIRPTFICCRAVIPFMKKNGYGRIVSVSSRTGLLGAGDYAAYAVAKGAIRTFTISLAEEVLEDNILVNAIAPSTIDTEANRAAMPKAKHEKWVKPADIAKAILYLCSENNQVTSGTVLPVYGRA